MIVLAMSLLALFAVSVAALVAPSQTQYYVISNTWNSLDDNDKESIQNSLNCCGFNNSSRNHTSSSDSENHPACNTTILTRPDVRKWPSIVFLPSISYSYFPSLPRSLPPALHPSLSLLPFEDKSHTIVVSIYFNVTAALECCSCSCSIDTSYFL